MNAPFRFAMLVVTIITIIENGAIVALTFVFREVRNVPQSALIVSMSVADLLIGMIVMPLALYYEFNLTWELGLVVCDFWISADIMCSTASILSIAFISIDKYFSLIHSSRYFGRERLRWVRLFVGVTWATATFVAFSAGASGWARAKPLPPRDFHADLDQVIADWPMRVNFSNISLRQALEYVENLESDAASQTNEEECTITNNPIFALYSGMVSFYLPATAILYFSCKIRWISALTLARHERITTQRMKMMKNKAMKRKNSAFAGAETDLSPDECDIEGSPPDDDEAAFREYRSISSKGAKMARRSAMGLRAVGKQQQQRRAGMLQAAESAFADEIFSEESETRNELSPVGENEVAMLGPLGDVPQNSVVTYPSVSSVGAAMGVTPRQRSSTARTGSLTEQARAAGHRLSSWGESHKHANEHWFKRLQASVSKPANIPTSVLHRTSHPSSAQLSCEASPNLSHFCGRRAYNRRATLNGGNGCGCGGSDLPSSIRYIDETSFSERQHDAGSTCDNNFICPTVSARVASNIVRKRSSLRYRQSFTNGNGNQCSAFFDDISMRFIDDSTVTSCARSDLAADLLPLPSLPPGVILPGSTQLRRSVNPNDSRNYDHDSPKPSPSLSYQVNRDPAPTEFQLLEPRPRRSTGGSSIHKRATAVLSRLKSHQHYHHGSTQGHRSKDNHRESIINPHITNSNHHNNSIRRKLSRLSTKFRNVDADGHLSAIGEYRSYMKAMRRKERRTATLWLATVITFLGCWAPFFFCYPLSCFIEVPVELMILLPWLGYANSTINPILHAFVEPVFLKALAKFILNLLPPHWL